MGKIGKGQSANPVQSGFPRVILPVCFGPGLFVGAAVAGWLAATCWWLALIIVLACALFSAVVGRWFLLRQSWDPLLKQKTDPDRNKIATAATMTTGAIVGLCWGTFICPGLGTVIGGVLGVLIFGFISARFASAVDDKGSPRKGVGSGSSASGAVIGALFGAIFSPLGAAIGSVIGVIVAGAIGDRFSFVLFPHHKDKKTQKIKERQQRTAIGFAVTGTIVGGAVGGLVGSLVPVLGTVLGAAIGSTVGTILFGGVAAAGFQSIRNATKKNLQWVAVIAAVSSIPGAKFGSLVGGILGSAFFPGVGSLAGVAIGAVVGMVLAAGVAGFAAWQYQRRKATVPAKTVAAVPVEMKVLQPTGRVDDADANTGKLAPTSSSDGKPVAVRPRSPVPSVLCVSAAPDLRTL